MFLDIPGLKKEFYIFKALQEEEEEEEEGRGGNEEEEGTSDRICVSQVLKRLLWGLIQKLGIL